MSDLPRFLVLISDQETDVPLGEHQTTPEIWDYEVGAESALAAVRLAIEEWHTEFAAERVAMSVSVHAPAS